MAQTVQTVPLRCRCGHVKGEARGVSPRSGFHVICHCADCRAFLRYLTPDGPPPAGADIFQMPPARIALTAGRDALACLRVSEAGVWRWYAGCCRTPLANTAGPGVPLAGLYAAMVDAAAGLSAVAALGPPLCAIFLRSAAGPLPEGTPPAPGIGLSARRMATLLAWWARGLARPSPFFDAGTKRPLAVPHVLTGDERASLYAE